MRLCRVDIIAVILFVLFVGAFFHQTFFEGKLPVPSDALVGLYHPWRDYYSDEYPRGVPFKNFLITDPVRELIPWRKITIDQWKDGKIPLWNPYNFAGTPMLSNIQAAVFYPLNIVFFLLPFIDAWLMLIMLQPLFAGLFMYWYLRSLKLALIACLVGALAWSFSGFNVAWMTWGTIGHVVLWLPLALLAIDNIVGKHKFALWHKSVFWSCIFVISMISQFFAGHAQISLYFILFVVVYAVFRRKIGFRFIFLLSLVAIITSIQWIPLLTWVRESGRVTLGADWHKEGWFLPWQHLVQFIAPDFFGNPTTLNYWGLWNYGELVGYIGMFPLIFAIIAMISGINRMRLFWFGALATALLFALPTPIASLPFVLRVPIISSLQPTRLIFIIDFALAVLAAIGCNEYVEQKRERFWRIPLVFIAIVLAMLWFISVRFSLDVSKRNLVFPTVIYIEAMILLIVYKRVSHVTVFRNIVTWSIIGLVVADLLRFGWKFTPFTPRAYFFPETKLITFLKQQQSPFRMMSVDKRILPPNTASYYRIESIEGYDPLISSRYEEFLASIARGKPDIAPPFGFNRIVTLESVNVPLLPMLGARYILSLSELRESYLKKVFQEGETRVYEDSRAVPRVYAVEKATIVNKKEEAIEMLYVIPDLQREAVVEAEVSLPMVPMGENESVRLMQYHSNQLEIEANLSVPRLLVVVNSYHPGWRATIDGNATPIYRTNYAFQGVVVPEGSHTVHVTFAL